MMYIRAFFAPHCVYGDMAAPNRASGFWIVDVFYMAMNILHILMVAICKP